MGEVYTHDHRPIRGGTGAGGAPYDPEAKAPLSLKQLAVWYRNQADVFFHKGQKVLARRWRQMAEAIDPRKH